MTERKRVAYLDSLRGIASFLVIVNHTNSYVFQAFAPGDSQWLLSIIWYYVSKMAVPLFVMLSGALLLPKMDSYRRTGQRILRMVATLIVFSYLYYVEEGLRLGGGWAHMLNIPGFLARIWTERITDSFWYLYFYIGLLAGLPLWQRMEKAMKPRDYGYMLALLLGVGTVWPLANHYVPGLALPEYTAITVPGLFIGLFFLGHLIHAHVQAKPWHIGAGLGLVAVSVAMSAGLTALEYTRVAPGEKYWFMDERTLPSLTIVLSAAGTMLAGKALSRRDPVDAPAQAQAMQAVQPIHTEGQPILYKENKIAALVGRCAFGVYLLQDMVIAKSQLKLFVPLSQSIPPFAAVLVWEIAVYAVCLGISWVLCKIPVVRKLVA